MSYGGGATPWPRKPTALFGSFEALETMVAVAEYEPAAAGEK